MNDPTEHPDPSEQRRADVLHRLKISRATFSRNSPQDRALIAAADLIESQAAVLSGLREERDALRVERYERYFGHRCSRMPQHAGPPSDPSMLLPVPCPDCFSVESLTRRVPFVEGSQRGFMAEGEPVDVAVLPPVEPSPGITLGQCPTCGDAVDVWDDLALGLRVRTRALHHLALEGWPGPDGQDYIDRERLIDAAIARAYEDEQDGEPMPTRMTTPVDRKQDRSRR